MEEICEVCGLPQDECECVNFEDPSELIPGNEY